MKPKKINAQPIDRYSVAPFNFVSLPKNSQIRYKTYKELPKHDSFNDKERNELLSGYIDYKLEAKTPIIVSGGTVKRDGKNQAFFFKNCSGEYAIPGNTIRGMIRTNLQILSQSSFVGGKNKKGQYGFSDIEDTKFLYRDIAGNNSLSKKYGTILGISAIKRIAENLKAGYIKNENGKFSIIPAQTLIEGVSYFRVSEIALRKLTKGKVINGINFMYEESFVDKDEKLKELNESIAETIERNQKFQLERERSVLIKEFERGGYNPYQTRISFEIDSRKRKIVRIGNSDEYKHKGYILSGGFIRGKLSHYIVPDVKRDVSPIPISNELKESYYDDMINTKKAKKGSAGIKVSGIKNEYFDFPERGKLKPVFYIYENDELHFGFTPYLRLFYKKSVIDGVRAGNKDLKGISYSEGLFGFSNKEVEDKKNTISYKSRVSFIDAVAFKGCEVDEESTMEILLAEPKPTSYNLYLNQKSENKKELIVYDDDFTIRGVKQYWMKDYIEEPDITNRNMSFYINPLKEGTCFQGRIYFDNLYEDELGLLLWSLKLEEDCFQNIGLAKPFGFGRVKVQDLELYVEDLKKKYETFSFDYYIKKNEYDFIEKYKEYFSKEKLNGRSIDEEKSVKELMHIKSKIIKLEDANNFRYMKIRMVYEGRNGNNKKNEFVEKKILPKILTCQSAYKKRNGERNRGFGQKKGKYE